MIDEKELQMIVAAMLLDTKYEACKKLSESLGAVIKDLEHDIDMAGLQYDDEETIRCICSVIPLIHKSFSDEKEFRTIKSAPCEGSIPREKIQRAVDYVSKLKLPIHEITDNTRVVSCLRAENINTVEDVLKATQRDLIRTPNFGKKSFDELKRAILGIGIDIPEQWLSWR